MNETSNIVATFLPNYFFLGELEKYAKSDYQLRHVCPHGTPRLPLEDFHEIWYLSIFRKSVEKIHVSLKLDMKTNIHFLMISLSVLLRMRNVSDNSRTELRNTFSIQ